MKRLEKATRLRNLNDMRELLSIDLETTWDLKAMDPDTLIEYEDLKYRAGAMTGTL